MGPEELNEILLHAVPNYWERKAYLKGWDFEGITYKSTCDMCECMEIAEAIYEGRAPSKNTQRAKADRASSGRKKKGGPSASPSNPKKGRTVKCNRNDAGHPRDEPTDAKNICMLHGPRHSSEECKVLQDYSKKHIAQQLFEDEKARSGDNKRGKTIKFESNVEEANIMKSHDKTTPTRRREKSE